eukprot:scaffold13650_cov33-Attheya_sp.AAC.2
MCRNNQCANRVRTIPIRFAEQLATRDLKPPSGRPKPEFVLRDLLVSFRRRLVPGPRRKFKCFHAGKIIGGGSSSGTVGKWIT